MLDLPVLILLIIYCTDTEMSNFRKMDFSLNPSVSLLKLGINRLIKEENYCSLFQLKSLSQIWMCRFRKKFKQFQKTIKELKKFDFS